MADLGPMQTNVRWVGFFSAASAFDGPWDEYEALAESAEATERWLAPVHTGTDTCIAFQLQSVER